MSWGDGRMADVWSRPLYLFSDWVPRLELDQARFLWVSDLVRPDNGIVLIWCAIAILAGYITFKRRNLAVAGQRFAAALVPLMIAGLAWYYTWPRLRHARVGPLTSQFGSLPRHRTRLRRSASLG
jgi:hypothetical protein